MHATVTEWAADELLIMFLIKKLNKMQLAVGKHMPTLTVLSTMALSQLTSICEERSGSGGSGIASLAASPPA